MDRFLLGIEQDMLTRDSVQSAMLVGSRLELTPTPSSSGTVYLLVGRTHTQESFPATYEYLLVKKIAAICAVELANKRAKFTSIRIGSESIALRDPQWLLSQAAGWDKEFTLGLGAFTFISSQLCHSTKQYMRKIGSYSNCTIEKHTEH